MAAFTLVVLHLDEMLEVQAQLERHVHMLSRVTQNSISRNVVDTTTVEFTMKHSGLRNNGFQS